MPAGGKSSSQRTMHHMRKTIAGKRAPLLNQVATNACRHKETQQKKDRMLNEQL
jgi:hypothetical protein